MSSIIRGIYQKCKGLKESTTSPKAMLTVTQDDDDFLAELISRYDFAGRLAHLQWLVHNGRLPGPVPTLEQLYQSANLKLTRKLDTLARTPLSAEEFRRGKGKGFRTRSSDLDHHLGAKRFTV